MDVVGIGADAARIAETVEGFELLAEILDHVVAFGFAMHQDVQTERFLLAHAMGDFGTHEYLVTGGVQATRPVPAALPGWLVAEYAGKVQLATVRLGRRGIARQIFLGMRESDVAIDYLQAFITIARHSDW